MENIQSRRDLITRTLPAAAVVSAAFGAATALGQHGGNNNAAGGHGNQPAAATGAHPDGNDPSPARKVIAGAADAKRYNLPQLPYAYDALEPHIDTQTMQLHHSKHHAGYVDNLNAALKKMTELAGTEQPDRAAIEALQRDISFNGGGHILHTMFWSTMAPNAGGEPHGEIADAINSTYGSFANFKRYFSTVAGSVKGSGWGILAVEPIAGRLMTYGLGDQDQRLIAGTVPILLIDVWEHAYYLKYQNRRADYITAWWNVVDWNAVNTAFNLHQMPHRAPPQE